MKNLKTSISNLDSILNELESSTDICLLKIIDSKMQIASRLDDYRKELGFKSKREFAIFFNKRPSEIQKWLSGKHNFTLVEIGVKLSIDYRQRLTSKRKFVKSIENSINLRATCAQWEHGGIYMISQLNNSNMKIVSKNNSTFSMESSRTKEQKLKLEVNIN